MLHENLKKGSFRWRRKYNTIPSRTQLLKDIGIDWLANRLDNIIHMYIYKYPAKSVESIRVREFEFVYIIQKTQHFYSAEIIQKEPFIYGEQY